MARGWTGGLAGGRGLEVVLQKGRDLDTFILVQRDQVKRRNGRGRMVLEHRWS